MNNERNLSSGIIHCIAASIFLISSIVLIVFTCINKSAIYIVFITIFATISFLYFLFSSIYHISNISTFFKKFDCILNQLLLSSSIFPIYLCIVKGAIGWTLFGITIAISLLSIIMIAIWSNIPRIIYSIFYFLIISIFIISLLPLYKFIIIYPNLIFFIISILLFFFAEIVDLMSINSNINKRFHILAHILIFVAILFIYIFFFIFIFNS